MGRNECGSNAMVTVQMTVEEYLEMKSRQEAKEVTTKQKNLVYGLEGRKTLSVMPDLIGHPSLTELLDELLRLRILLVIHPHHLLNRVGNPRACLRMTFDPPDTARLQLKMKFSRHPERSSFHLLLFLLCDTLYRDLSLTAHRRILPLQRSSKIL